MIAKVTTERMVVTDRSVITVRDDDGRQVAQGSVPLWVEGTGRGAWYRVVAALADLGYVACGTYADAVTMDDADVMTIRVVPMDDTPDVSPAG